MKKALLTLACVLATIACHAQGTVNFAMRVPTSGIDAKVYTDPSMTTGLSGSGYSMQLYGGPQGAAESALVPIDVPLVGFRTGAVAGYSLTTSKVVAVPGVAAGSRATLQVRAWDNAGGTITSWANATSRGSSVIITSGPLGGPDPGGGPPILQPDLVGMQSFSIPEPSTIALGILGAAALLLRRRK